MTGKRQFKALRGLIKNNSPKARTVQYKNSILKFAFMVQIYANLY